jgi:hypothetical protein
MQSDPTHALYSVLLYACVAMTHYKQEGYER